MEKIFIIRIHHKYLHKCSRNTPKEYDETEIANIIESFEAMESEEYENADPELKAIYISYGLENRRKNHLEKVG